MISGIVWIVLVIASMIGSTVLTHFGAAPIFNWNLGFFTGCIAFVFSHAFIEWWSHSKNHKKD